MFLDSCYTLYYPMSLLLNTIVGYKFSIPIIRTVARTCSSKLIFRYVLLVTNCDQLFQSICYVCKRYLTFSTFRSVDTSPIDAL